MHHTGIKTSAAFLFAAFGHHFNCTIQELKQPTIFEALSPKDISIAPYRN
ncbi:hypothetical protein HMPREF1553_00482 [Porphyromonas gingivalis F0568]|nr:hypothetical protein HMPREF1553_00482 [Porphyromonas gingivalis F0568]